MIEIGRCVRYFKDYAGEVNFSIKHNFDFMQVWYDSNGISICSDKHVKQEIIKEMKFPTIIHAVLDINEFKEYVPKAIELANYLGHKELIIHPICASEEITSETIHKLSKNVSYALTCTNKEDIVLYLENNSKLDPIFTASQEIQIIIEDNPNLEFLLDIAHIDDYKHLKEMIAIKTPKILHIADRHFNVTHEHLPLGEGDIDYNYIFREILVDFDGKIVLEVDQSDEAIIKSRDKLNEILKLI